MSKHLLNHHFDDLSVDEILKHPPKNFSAEKKQKLIELIGDEKYEEWLKQKKKVMKGKRKHVIRIPDIPESPRNATPSIKPKTVYNYKYTEHPQWLERSGVLTLENDDSQNHGHFGLREKQFYAKLCGYNCIDTGIHFNYFQDESTIDLLWYTHELIKQRKYVDYIYLNL